MLNIDTFSSLSYSELLSCSWLVERLIDSQAWWCMLVIPAFGRLRQLELHNETLSQGKKKKEKEDCKTMS
jgi:hypothetical protein